MKLLNRSLLYLSISFFFIIGIWSVIFYINLKDEIRDSIDDGLENNKLLLIQKVATDSTLLLQREFGGNNFEIHPIDRITALQVRDVYKDTLMYRQNEDDMEPVRILHSAFANDGKYYRIKIISSLVEEDDLLEDAFWSVVWLFFILVASIILINNLILRRVWNPFHELVARLRKFRLEKDTTAISVKTTTPEFLELQQAANALIRHSQEAFLSQKQFTENASHELQTPLAVISNKLELLLESETLNSKDAQTVAEVIQMAERMVQLNKSLLLLAKIENKQFDEPTSIGINSLLEESLTHFEEYIEYRNIEISKKFQNSITVFIDPSLARILVSNLIKNAVFHNIENGHIQLFLEGSKMTVCNAGSNKALNPEIVFQRFQKDANNNQSTGLGLAVCKAVCEFYDIPISYYYNEGEHCFVIDFTKIAKVL